MIELIDKRKPNEKRFLKDNGNIEIQLFRNNIHYLKDGKYEEISNELKENKDSLENTENDYKVIFNKKTGSIRYNKENNYIEFIPKDYKKIECILEKNTKEVSKVLYKNIVDNIDLEYVLSFEGVKENIIINEYTKLDKIQFDIKSNLTIKNENKVLEARKGKELLFDFSIPYMKDSNGNESDEVTYSVRKKEEDQLLTISFSNEWLKSKNRKYPIIIDPTYENNTNVADTYIYPGDTYDTRYNRNYLNVGVEKVNNQDVVNRGLIRFKLPDDLGPSEEIIRAELILAGYFIVDNRVPTENEMMLNTEKLVNIHQLTSDWTLEGANWNNMNSAYNSDVENVAYLSRSYLEYDITDPDPYNLKPVIQTNLNECLITNLVRKWLTGTPNYGIMIKQSQENYINELAPKLFSCNYSDGRLAPLLRIEYRNQNGIEPYWDYMKQPFTNGDTYVNTFNGNLIALFNLANTIGVFPASLGISYNTNDVIQDIETIFGKGYKTTYDQIIEDLSTGSNYVLKYTDGDGTSHIFYGEENENHTIIYSDIDGLDMSIESVNSNYVLRDNQGNEMTFSLNNLKYYLSSIKNIKNQIISITRNNNNYITKITDCNNNEINISYGVNTISIVSSSDTTILGYENNNLKTITTKDGITSFTYDNSNLITKITDVNGLSVEYEYLIGDLKKVSKITQIGLNNTEGQSINIDYNLFNTKITDNNGLVINKVFGYYGNLLSSNNMSNGANIKKAYSLTSSYGNETENKNKILTSTIPTRFSKNYFKYTNYDNLSDNTVLSHDMDLLDYNDLIFDGNSLVEFISSNVTQYALTGFSLQSGNDYTVSLYVKTTLSSKIKFYIDSSNILFERTIVASNDYQKIRFSFNKNSSSDLMMKIEHDNACSTYIGDIYIEEGLSSNDYNLVINPDFSNGTSNWNLVVQEIDDNQNNNLNPSDYIQVVDIDSFGNKALRINMESQNKSDISQTLSIKGNANNMYYLSFWYKNNGIETGVDPTIPYDPYGSIVGNTVSIVAVPLEGQPEHCVPATALNTCKDVWQCCHFVFEPSESFNSLIIKLHQGRDTGQLFITNFTLIKKLKTDNYSYDENGNVIEISNNSGINVFNYDKNNELISATNPRGRHFKIEYDNIIKDRVIRAISSSGISNKALYDVNGNPIQSKISKDYSEEIDTGFYKIRQKGTNNYLKIENDVLSLKYDYCSNSTFKITKTNDLYTISDAIISNKYITEEFGNIIIKNTGNKDFKIEKNDNASYHIYYEYIINQESHRKYLKWMENHFEFVDNYQDINDNYLYEYYLEDAKRLFIEVDAEYTQDGRFISKVKDSLLNENSFIFNNSNGLLIKTINAKGDESNYVYNNKKQLIKISQGNKEVNYSYNNQNLLSSIVYGNKNYQFNYDNFLNISNIKVNNIDLVSNSYGPNNGNLLSSTYGNNDVISFQYDDYGRLKNTIKEDETYECSYDNNGQIDRVKETNSNTYFYYDSKKRLSDYVNERYSNYFSITNKYDSDDNIINQINSLNQNNNSISNTFDLEGKITESNINNTNIKYSYDELKRLIRKELNNNFEIIYDYISIGNRTSSLLKSIKNGNEKYSYKYDKLYNITDIYLNNNLINHYVYDSFNQLILDEDFNNNIKTEYVYDSEGNIISKTKKNLNTDVVLSTDTYEYNSSAWEDLLTKYNNDSITYDAIGNPLTIGSKTLSWINGRQLSSLNSNSLSVSYKYDLNGIRIKKTVNGVDTMYYLDGTKIVYEKTGNNELYYLYDINGISGLKYNNMIYLFLKNIQGDILGIIDSNSQLVAKYEYDSLGNIISIKNANGQIITDNTHVAIVNPFRYRGYYYDKETELYYLNTRYYNPKWGRFLNADGIVCSNRDFSSYNLFLYVSNNYIKYSDTYGCGWFDGLIDTIGDVIQKGVDTAVSIGKAIGKGIEYGCNKFLEGIGNVVIFYERLKASPTFEIGVGTGFSVNTEVSIYNKNISIGAGDYKDDTNTFSKNGATCSLKESKYVKASIIEYDKTHEYYYKCGNKSKALSIKDSESLDIGFSSASINASGNSGFIGIKGDFHFYGGGHIKVGWDVEIKPERHVFPGKPNMDIGEMF